MITRLFIAVPFAAAVVVALYLALDGVLFPPLPGQPGPTCVFSRGPDGKIVCRCYSEEKFAVKRSDKVIQPPPPLHMRPDPAKPQGKSPRERMDPPEPDRQQLLRADPCAQRPIVRISPIWPADARHGDYAIVEFTIGADGVPGDVEVVESSNPKIHSDVIRQVTRWRYKCADDRHADEEPERRRIRIEFAKEDEMRR